MKTIKKSNFRVIIEPQRLGDLGAVVTSDEFFYTEEQIPELYEDRCKEMIEQIKRHVDNVGYVYIDCEKEEICSLCGYTWEQDENGIPMCCDDAVKEMQLMQLENEKH